MSSFKTTCRLIPHIKIWQIPLSFIDGLLLAIMTPRAGSFYYSENVVNNSIPLTYL